MLQILVKLNCFNMTVKGLCGDQQEKSMAAPAYGTGDFTGY